jgi:hypothetical protein
VGKCRYAPALAKPPVATQTVLKRVICPSWRARAALMFRTNADACLVSKRVYGRLPRSPIGAPD